MSAVLSHRNGSAAFVQLTRLFSGLKRSGRVMDVIWFQQNPEYARTILALADENDDPTVREIANTLRRLLPDYLELEPVAPSPRATGRVAAITVPAPATTAENPGPEEEPTPENRYVGRLR